MDVWFGAKCNGCMAVYSNNSGRQDGPEEERGRASGAHERERKRETEVVVVVRTRTRSQIPRIWIRSREIGSAGYAAAASALRHFLRPSQSRRVASGDKPPTLFTR